MTGRTRAVSQERARLKAAWSDEWRDGLAAELFQKYDGEREVGGFPLGLHGWPLDRKNAWYAGFNYGRCQRLRENG